MQKHFGEHFNNWYNKGMAKSVTFVVTDDCNLRCSYCYQHNKSSTKMSIETAKNIVDFLFEQDLKGQCFLNEEAAPCLILDFIGGEPFLEIELIDKTIDYFRETAVKKNHRWALHHMISMTTNGTLYFQDNVQHFLNKNKGRVSVSVTIDGNKSLHDACRKFPDGSGSYELAANAFRDILNRHGQKGTKMTLSPDNIKYLYTAFIGMVTAFNLSHLNANCVFEEGWNSEHSKLFYNELVKIADWIIESKRYESFKTSLFDDWIGEPLDNTHLQNWCGGTGKMLAFDSSGNIYPCLRYTASSLGDDVEPFIIGNIRDGFSATQEQCARCACLEKIDRRTQSTDECFNCPIASGCAWCSAYNYQVFGTPDRRATFICVMHKARVLANVYYWNKYYRTIGSDERYTNNVPDEWALEIISQDELDMLKSLAE